MKKRSGPSRAWPRFSPSMLDDIVDNLMRGEALDQFTAPAVLEICKAIRDGRDARELFGIKPSLGAPAKTKKYRIWIAQHYARLRATPGSQEKADAGRVAEAWGISMQTVRKCFIEHKVSASIGIAYEPGTIEAIVKRYAPEYERLRRKG